MSIVYIDEKLNKHFDPIDLFIRLNNRPYPVKDHTFEMWNHYSDREIITKIKVINAEYAAWFYYRINNARMLNEEWLTILAYLTDVSKPGLAAVFKKIDIYISPASSLIFSLVEVIGDRLAK